MEIQEEEDLDNGYNRNNHFRWWHNICYSRWKIYDGTKYVYLVDRNNELNFCIRKTEIENGKEYLINLDDRKEFELALSILAS